MEFEIKLIQYIQAGASDTWTAFFKTISLLGSWLGALLFLIIILVNYKRFHLRFLIVYLFGICSNFLLNYFIARPRPFETYNEVMKFTNSLGNSCPSGHATSCTIIAIFACHFAIKFAKKRFTKIAVVITMCLYVGLVCLSRMYLGMHYLTDLIAGIVMGFLSVAVSFLFSRKRRRIRNE